MADEHNSKPGSNAGKGVEETTARHQIDAERLEEEREALNKAREQQESAASNDENENGLGNLHYGDEEGGDYLKGVNDAEGGSQSHNLNQDDPAVTNSDQGDSTPGNSDPQSFIPQPEATTGNEADAGAQGNDSSNGNNGQGLDGLTIAQSAVQNGVGSVGSNTESRTSENAIDSNEVNRAQVNDAPTDIQLSDNVVAENEAGAVVATLSASDPDANDTVTFTIADDPSGFFEVVGDQLKLKEGVELDYEVQDAYQVTLVATDEAGATYQETVTINVADANDAPEGLALSNNNVAENAAGAVIGDLSLTDADAGDTHSYLVSDDRFEVLDGQLKLKDGVSLDHEASDSVSITVTATDAGGLETEATFNISVGDINEAPNDLSLSNSSVAENAAGAVVGGLSLSDADAGDSHTYVVSDNRFEVVDGQLKLKDGVSLDHEASDSVSVTVTATDAGGLETQSTFDIAVDDVNEAPTALNISNDTIAENDTGAVVATLTSSDPDANDSAAYAVAEDTSGLFEVIGDQLKLKDGVSLDHEGQDAYELTLEVTDGAGASYQEVVTINVADLNEGPTDITLNGNSINENDAGAVVATLTSADPDAGDSAAYALAEDASGFFEVVGDQLKLKDGVSLDHESQDSYEVTLEVTDGSGASYQETVTINVADVNEAPTEITLSDTSVDENDAGAVVANLSSADPDAGDSATYALADDPSGLFEVVGDQLKLKDGVSLDREAQDSYDVTLRVTDSDGLAFEDTVTINVADVNEAPTDFALTPTQSSDPYLSLNQDGGNNDLAIASDIDGFPTDAITVEVTFASSQTDVGSGVPLFSYAANNGSNNEALIWLESSSGNVAIFLAGRKITTDIPNSSLLDGEEHQVSFTWDQASNELSVYVDGAAEFSTSVNIRDLRADGTVTLGQEQDTEGGRFDTNQIFEGEISEVRIFDYARSADEIADNADGPLADPQSESGLVTNWQMDAETGGVVQDLAGDNDLVLSNGATIEGGGPVYDAPTVEEGNAGDVVGTLSAIDPDTGAAITDFAIADDASGLFEVVGDQLKLKEGVSTDHEAQDSYELTIQATDETGLSSEYTITVNVADINEGPTDIALSNNTVSENDAGAVVATLTSSDPDAGDTASYSIADDASGLFEVVGDQLKLKDGASLDHEDQDSYELTLEVTDGAGASYQETVTINVADVNEAPIDIEFGAGGDGAFAEQGGQLVIEAEHYDANNAGSGGHEWGDSSTDGAVHVDDGSTYNNMWTSKSAVENNAPELTYQVQFDTPGEYYIHIRGAAEDGPTGNADSVHIGLNGERLTGDGGITGFGSSMSWGSRDTYTGQQVKITVDEPGTYELNLWAREDGVAVDKIVLTQDVDYRPSGEGPDESPRVGDGESDVLSEAAGEGTVVATLTAVDPDVGDTHTFEIVDSDGNPVADDNFEIVGNEIRVKAGADLNFEDDASHDVFVKTTDAAGESYTETVTINLGDENEAPSDLTLSNASVAENADGAVVGDLSLTDVDAGDSHTYAVSDDRFEVVDGQLKLKDGVSLNHEEADSVDVTVTATDSGGLETEATFNVEISDVNEAPTDIIFTKTGAGETVDATVEDADITTGNGGGQGTATVVLPDGADGARVVIDFAKLDNSFELEVNGESLTGGTIQLQSNVYDPSTESFLQFEDGSAISQPWVVGNDGGPRIQAVITEDGVQFYATRSPSSSTLEPLELVNGDATSPAFLSGDNTVTVINPDGAGPDGLQASISASYEDADTTPSFSINEHDAGVVVATLSSSDPDVGDTASYSIADDPSGAFEVVGNQLKLKDDASLDYADGAERNVTVEVTDSAGNRYQETVTINVEDVNSAPTLELASGTGLEASYYDVGHSIRNLNEVDFDATPDSTAVVDSLNHMTGGEPFWEGGPDNFFAAKYEGQLVVENGGSYTINLASDDGSMLFIDGQPVLDNDGLHGTRTRSVTLDLEEGSHDVEVRYFENGGAQTLQMSWSGPDTGNVNQLIEGDAFQHGAEADSLSLAEDTPGAVVAQLAVTDVDPGDTHSYEVSDDRFEVAEVDGAPTLKLKDGVSIDHETEGSVNVSVTVFDAAGESDTADFTIAVDDVNAAPTIGLAGNEGLQASYYDVGGSISRLSDIDFDGAPDATAVVDSLNYETGNEKFWDGGPDNYFAAKYEGELVVQEGGSYTLNLSSDDGSMVFIDGAPVIDNDGLHSTSTQSVTLDLEPGAHNIEVRYFENTGSQTLKLTWSGPDTDGNTELLQGEALQQPGTFGAEASLTVTENAEGAIAAMLAASDPDGDALSFTVSDDRFEVVDVDSSPALKLKDGVSLDYESETQVNVTVTATDEHGESASADFTVNVADVDEGPTPLAGATAGADRLNGTSEDDLIDGLAGNDRLNGRDGADTILGGDGKDDLRGGNGEDRLEGGDGDDKLSGQNDDDMLIGGAGNDRLNGGNGDDTLIGGAGNDTMNGGAGDDTFVVTGSDEGFDRFNGGKGNDAIVAGGDDTVIGVNRFSTNIETISADGHANVTIQGDAGNNNLNFSKTQLDGIDAIDGGDGNDRITGSKGDDTILGGDGKDNLRGGNGDDRLEGGDGNDRLDGGTGADTLVGGAGDDTMTGGSGDDTFVVTGGDQGFDRFNGGSGNDAIVAGGDDTVIGISRFSTNIETISADGHDNVTIQGDAGNNNLNFSKTQLDGIEVIDGGDGNDRITGSKGDDTIQGGEGNDRLAGGDGNDHLEGGAGKDDLRGGDGNDRLEGGDGDDRLFGQDGDDVMVGGLGDDAMNGGAGDDVFVYAQGDGSDTIRAGGGDWTDTIQIEGGMESLGEFGVDWTIELTRGSIDSVDADKIDLSQNADGVVTLNDGSTIEFQDVEQII